MKRVTLEDRQQYLQLQLERFTKKFHFCKVSVQDVARYRALIRQDAKLQGRSLEDLGPILCLGTRTGREVDLFRCQFFGPPLLWRMVSLMETFGPGAFRSGFPAVEAFGRSRLERLFARSVIGVELNPRGARPDVWIGSFDEMPQDWEGTFGIVYSNSFDHCQDPVRTIREWKRVLRPGGYMILCYAVGQQPSATQPVGEIQREDLLELLGREMIYFCHRGSGAGYSEVIVRLPSVVSAAGPSH